MTSIERNMIVGILCLMIFVIPVYALEAPLNQDLSNEFFPFEIKGYTNPIIIQYLQGPQIETPESGQIKATSIPEQMDVKVSGAIKKYDLVSFDQNPLNEEVRSGTGLTLRIRGKDYKADLTRMDFENIDDGIDTFSGTITGEEESNVLITISRDVTLGSVTLKDETFYIEPVPSRVSQEENSPIVHIIYSSKDFEAKENHIDNGPQKLLGETERVIDLENSIGALVEESSGQETLSLPAQQGMSPDQTVTVDILVVTDEEFSNIYKNSNTWVPVAYDLIASANQAFEREDIKVKLYPVLFDDSRKELLSQDPEIATDPLIVFKKIYPDTDLNKFDADIALYLGGIDRIGPNDDDQGGSFYFTEGRHAWAQMVGDDPYPGYTGNQYGRRCITLHELGHLFGADHEDSGGFEQASVYFDPLIHHTVMYSFYLEIYNVPEFSSDEYHGDLMHDNARRIREAKNTVSHLADSSVKVPVSLIYKKNGRIIPGADNPNDVKSYSILSGDSFSFTIRSSPGYIIDQVQVNGQTVSDAEGTEIYILTVPNIIEATTIRATFKQKQIFYLLTPSAGNHGSISPSDPVIVPYQGIQTFIITPDPGYAIQDVRVDGDSVGQRSSYTFFTVTNDHKIKVTFETALYTITPAAGAHGQISPSTVVTVPRGGSQTFFILSSPGYLILDVMVDGKSVGPVPIYTFTNVQDNHKIKATFKQTKQTFTITPSTGLHGTISPSTPVTVQYGGSQTFTIRPDPEYVIDRVLVSGFDVGPLSSYIFTNIQVDQTISASFKPTAPPQPASADWVWSRDGWGDWQHTASWSGYEVGPNSEYGPVMVDDHGEHGTNNNLDGGSTQASIWRTFSDPSGTGWNTLTFNGVLQRSDVPGGRWMEIEVNGQQVFYATELNTPPGEWNEPFEITVSFPQTATATVKFSHGQSPAWGPRFMMEYHALKLSLGSITSMRAFTASSEILQENVIVSNMTETAIPAKDQ